VLLVDKHVWNGALAREVGKRLLEVVAVALLVQLVHGILGAVSIEEALGVFAVGAVSLVEDDCGKERNELTTACRRCWDEVPTTVVWDGR
jgi:hypothetical protein